MKKILSTFILLLVAVSVKAHADSDMDPSEARDDANNAVRDMSHSDPDAGDYKCDGNGGIKSLEVEADWSFKINGVHVLAHGGTYKGSPVTLRFAYDENTPRMKAILTVGAIPNQLQSECL